MRVLTGKSASNYDETMSATRSLAVKDSIWVRSGLTDQQAIFSPIRDALREMGITILTVNGPEDLEGLERIRKSVWSSDAHVILDGMMPRELKRLRSVFEDRRRFSMALVDWWTSDYWFTRHADFLIFRNYSGIAVRRRLGVFAPGRRPPLLPLPRSRVPFEMLSCAMRLPALLAAPFLELWKWRQRNLEAIMPERMLYFPFSVTEKHVPLNLRTPEFDFSNLGSTGGYWLCRDPHASAWLNFGNLYYDRLRLIKLLLKVENEPYRIFDVRRLPGRHIPTWEGFCQAIGRTRYVIATGGLHQNSVAKYLEFACFGVPMLGEQIPFEFPWLEKCLFPIDTLRVTVKQLKPLLQEALHQQPSLRDNCLALRDPLLRMYSPRRLLEVLQDQANGKPLPPGYLKPEST